MLYQLIGYALLDYEDEYHINDVGIYLTRQAKTLQWELNELLDRLHADTPAPPLADLRHKIRTRSKPPRRTYQRRQQTAEEQVKRPTSLPTGGPEPTLGNAATIQRDSCVGG